MAPKLHIRWTLLVGFSLLLIGGGLYVQLQQSLQAVSEQLAEAQEQLLARDQQLLAGKSRIRELAGQMQQLKLAVVSCDLAREQSADAASRRQQLNQNLSQELARKESRIKALQAQRQSLRAAPASGVWGGEDEAASYDWSFQDDPDVWADAP